MYLISMIYNVNDGIFFVLSPSSLIIYTAIFVNFNTIDVADFLFISIYIENQEINRMFLNNYESFYFVNIPGITFTSFVLPALYTLTIRACIVCSGSTY